MSQGNRATSEAGTVWTMVVALEPLKAFGQAGMVILVQ